MELGPLLYKNLYKFAKNLHSVRSIHIFAIVYVGNKFSSQYCVHFNVVTGTFYMQFTIL